MRGHVLTAWVGGPRAAALARYTRDGLVEQALRALGRADRCDADPAPLDAQRGVVP